MLRCRIFGHAWDEVSIGAVIDEFRAPLGYREVVALKCMRCEAVRIDAWNRLGTLGNRRYIYDDGYKQLGDSLRGNTKPGTSTFLTAKKRYLAARRRQVFDQGEDEDGGDAPAIRAV